VFNLSAVEYATAERMLGHLVAVFGATAEATAGGAGNASEAAAPMHVGRIALLGAGNAVAKAAAARGPRRAHSLERPFEEFFASQVAAPERVAVGCGLALQPTYGELAARACAGACVGMGEGRVRG